MTCVKQAQEFLTDDTLLRDLGSASDWSCCMENLLRPIRSTIQIWLVAHHQYGILVLVAQTSFHRETSCGVTKCWLFSQAIITIMNRWEGATEASMGGGTLPKLINPDPD